MNIKGSRRHFVKNSLKFLFAAASIKYASLVTADEEAYLVTETQYGDPDSEKYESVTFDPSKMEDIARGGMRASFEERIPNFGEELLKTAEKFVGSNRIDDEDKIGDFLASFGLPFKDDNGPLAFCAAGISYVAVLVYLNKKKSASELRYSLSEIRSNYPDIDHHHFYPTPSVRNMQLVAQGKGRWLAKNEIKKITPGTIVVFDWKKNGGADHVGIVRKVNENSISTIEFNTSFKSTTNPSSNRNGGAVAFKERDLDATIKGFILIDKKTLV